MLIRSQNKKVLLNFDRLSGIEVVCGIDDTAKITANDSRTYYLLGDYSNSEKAMEVLNMVQRSHNDSILTEITGKTIAERLDDLTQTEITALTEVLTNRETFQMPQDNEVEI